MGFAHRRFFEPRTYDKEVKKVSVSFAPAGTGAVTDVRGEGTTVARAAVGDFTVTLVDKWVDLLAANATLQVATATDQLVQIGTYDASARTVKVYVWGIAGAALEDVAADANNRVNVELYFKNTKVVR